MVTKTNTQPTYPIQKTKGIDNCNPGLCALRMSEAITHTLDDGVSFHRLYIGLSPIATNKNMATIRNIATSKLTIVGAIEKRLPDNYKKQGGIKGCNLKKM